MTDWAALPIVPAGLPNTILLSLLVVPLGLLAGWRWRSSRNRGIPWCGGR